jgi:hypothetical protein
VYEAAVSPGPERPGQAVLLAADAAAFLWRCWLCGYPPATLPWGAAHEYVTATPPPAAARPLWDAHAAVIYAGAGDGEVLDRLRERLRQADSASYPQARRVVLPLAEALAAFAEGAYEASIDFLEPVIPALVQLGGSNERQDIFEDTLIEAYLRTGHCGAAEVRLRQRLARRPSARDAFCLGRALTAAGRVKDAAAALHLAHDGWHLADADSPELSALERLWEELYSGQAL